MIMQWRVLMLSLNRWVIKYLLSPFGWKSLSLSVVSGQSMDSWLDQNQSVLGILILSALFQMLSDIDGFSNHAVDIFGDLGGTSWITIRIPFFFRILVIFWPVKSLVLGTASLSLMTTPICDGLTPFLAIATINSVMVLGVWVTHLEILLLKGVTVELIPFPFPCIEFFPFMAIIIKIICIKYLLSMYAYKIDEPSDHSFDILESLNKFSEEITFVFHRPQSSSVDVVMIHQHVNLTQQDLLLLVEMHIHSILESVLQTNQMLIILKQAVQQCHYRLDHLRKTLLRQAFVVVLQGLTIQ